MIEPTVYFYAEVIDGGQCASEMVAKADYDAMRERAERAEAYAERCTQANTDAEKENDTLRATAERRLALLEQCNRHDDAVLIDDPMYSWPHDLQQRVVAELTASGAQGDGK